MYIQFFLILIFFFLIYIIYNNKQKLEHFYYYNNNDNDNIEESYAVVNFDTVNLNVNPSPTSCIDNDTCGANSYCDPYEKICRCFPPYKWNYIFNYCE